MREMTSARQRLKNSPLPKVVLGVALAAGLTMTAAIPANAEVSSSTPSEVVGVERVGGLGTGDGQFNEPNDVAVNDSGQLLVVDNKNHRVQIMDPDGSGSYTYAGQFGNGRGSGVDQFNLPRSIDIAANGDVLIGERNNNRVSIWRPDGTGNYTPFGTFGTRGEGEDQFKAPNDVDVMADGRVAVVDTEHNRLQIWQPDGSGNYVHELTFSDTSASGTALSYPQGITELSDGRLAVTDRDNDRIVLFADDGAGSYAYDSEITGVGTSGEPSVARTESWNKAMATCSSPTRACLLNLRATATPLTAITDSCSTLPTDQAATAISASFAKWTRATRTRSAALAVSSNAQTVRCSSLTPGATM